MNTINNLENMKKLKEIYEWIELFAASLSISFLMATLADFANINITQFIPGLLFFTFNIILLQCFAFIRMYNEINVEIFGDKYNNMK